MKPTFLDFLYGSLPARFESDFGREESTLRLQQATKRMFSGALTHQQAVGTVSELEVVLARRIPFVRNSFAPYFVGSFKETGQGHVVLEGRFTMHWLVKVFLTFWFGFCLLWTTLAIYATWTSATAVMWWFPLAGVAMFGIGLVLVQLGKWLARDDTAWLSGIIREALSGGRGPANP